MNVLQTIYKYMILESFYTGHWKALLLIYIVRSIFKIVNVMSVTQLSFVSKYLYQHEINDIHASK